TLAGPYYHAAFGLIVARWAEALASAYPWSDHAPNGDKRRRAMSIEKWEYEEEIDRSAREALETEREYEQDAYEAAWEIVDGHRWVIYSALAALIPTWASSDGADLLESQDLDALYRERGLGGLHSLIAFACMLDDVQA